ncbi:hypothetical protein ACWIID_32695 [Streptomyces phaeochromogenes]
MTHDVANSVLASVIALRVFAPDAVALVRRMLGAGVRVGAAALMERRGGAPPNPGAPAGSVQPEDGGRR